MQLSGIALLCGLALAAAVESHWDEWTEDWSEDQVSRYSLHLLHLITSIDSRCGSVCKYTR